MTRNYFASFQPAVSVGNVGQLAVDLLITNLPNCKKIGRVFHNGLEPVVGNEISETGEVSLMTSCECRFLKIHWRALNLKLILLFGSCHCLRFLPWRPEARHFAVPRSGHVGELNLTCFACFL